MLYVSCVHCPSHPWSKALALVRPKRLKNRRAATLIHAASPSSFVCMASVLLVEGEPGLAECFTESQNDGDWKGSLKIT